MTTVIKRRRERERETVKCHEMQNSFNSIVKIETKAKEFTNLWTSVVKSVKRNVSFENPDCADTNRLARVKITCPDVS